MVWLLNGRAVLTISNLHGVFPSANLNVTAEKRLASKGDSWVFVLRNTERLHQGQVTCDLQGIDSKTASLFVQGLYVHMCIRTFVCVRESQRRDYVFMFAYACVCGCYLDSL